MAQVALRRATPLLQHGGWSKVGRTRKKVLFVVSVSSFNYGAQDVKREGTD
jgi:hypothetical protein